MTRARLNWMELSAMALGRPFLSTNDGISACEAGPPNAWAEPVMNDRTNIFQTSVVLLTCPAKTNNASMNARCSRPAGLWAIPAATLRESYRGLRPWTVGVSILRPQEMSGERGMFHILLTLSDWNCHYEAD